MQREETQQPDQSKPATDQSIEKDIAQFVRLDTEIKEARKQMKQVRDVVNGYKKKIIDYMVASKIDKLVGINNGTQYLECVSKTIKRRPTSDQILQAISAAMVGGKILEPKDFLEIIQNCGGTKTEYRLSRRTRRVNAIAAASALAAIKGPSETLNKKKKKKKTKIAVSELPTPQ